MLLLALRLNAKLPSPNMSSVLSNSLTGVSGLPDGTGIPGGKADSVGFCDVEADDDGSDTGGVGGAITFDSCAAADMLAFDVSSRAVLDCFAVDCGGVAVPPDRGALAFSTAVALSFSFSFSFSFCDFVRARSTLAVREGGLGGKG